MRATLLALVALLVAVANVQSHEDEHKAAPAPQVERSGPPQWSITVVSTQRSDRYSFHNLEALLRDAHQFVDDKTLFIMLHRNERLLDRWSRPQAE
jgi:hypothetical protein